jgi:hypothetical protein
VERLRTAIAVLIAGSLLAIGLPDLAWAAQPVAPIDYDAQLRDRDASILGRKHLVNATPKKATANRNPKRTYQRACATPDPSDHVPTGTCLPPTSFCPDPQRPNAYWIVENLTAAFEANDWSNINVIVCLSDAQAPKAVMTEQDFRRLRIPAPRIIVQPSGGHTLINIGTNFLTEKKPVILPTTVLGQPIQVRATPVSYLWYYGDGTELSTTNSGARYPNMLTPHTYRRPGTYAVQLRTTFTGEYSVNGGPWQLINGTATTQSPVVNVTAEERRAVIIG